ncbi:MAG: alpha/beta fold hydrolase [Lysobacterales bacterium]
MRAALLATLLLLPIMSPAEELSIERVYDAPALAGKTPVALKVSPDGRRVAFLRGKQTDPFQLDLWEYRIDDGQTALLVDSAALLTGDEDLSDEEKARRERSRTASFKGILQYDFSPDGGKLLFPANGELYLVDLDGQAAKPERITQRELGFVTDARVSPKGRYVSFVREHNLWVLDLTNQRSVQLTRDGGELVSNGQAEFIAQEEMGRSEGYWWAPDDSAIAFTRVDQAPVAIQRRFEINADSTDVIEQRYPAAGQANVAIKLGVIELERARPAAIGVATGSAQLLPAEAPVRWVDLGANADIYLARVDWTADSQNLAYQVQSRDQRRLDLRLWSRADAAQRTLLTETSETWVNLHDDLRFLKDGSGFIWQSEREGTRRLYLYAMDGSLKHPLTPENWVVDQLLAVDLAGDRLSFASGGIDPLQRQIFSVPIGSSGLEVTQLSHGEGMHAAVFADNGQVYVDTYSDPATPPNVRLYAADGKPLAVLEPNTLDENHPYWPYHQQHALPEFGSIEGAAGQTLYYRLTKPSGFDPGKRYPVFLYVYGGPHVQKVQKAWDDPLVQVMARRGYLVFSLDNRGSDRRGKAFEQALFRHMGGVEVVDQLEGVKWLKAQPYVDGERIGVFGWSYGGYMSLMLLAKASDQIACGVAGAPVTDWALYDTHYTERYMDHPAANAEGYAQSSVFAHLDGLKSPLYLVHGMADDNVLFTNSTRLMSALQQRGQAFELMTYPGGKHGLSSPSMKKHAYRSIIDFFDRRLKP